MLPQTPSGTEMEGHETTIGNTQLAAKIATHQPSLGRLDEIIQNSREICFQQTTKILFKNTRNSFLFLNCLQLSTLIATSRPPLD